MSLDALQVPVKEPPCKIVYVSISTSPTTYKGENNVVERCALDALFESFCIGVTFFGPFWDQVMSYWRGSLEDPKHVLFMRYDEVKAEPLAQIKRLAEFLECTFTDEGRTKRNGQNLMSLF